MKKKDIIELMEAKKVIESYSDLLSIVNWDLSELCWYPNIPEFQTYFKVLKKELLQAKEESETAMNTVKRITCSHDVRLGYHSLFASHNYCVLCGNCVSSDNVASFKESNYRNKYTVIFDAKYQQDEDGSYEIETGETDESVRKMILDIVESYSDEDEIDLVQEFLKLGLKNAEINTEKRKKETYILIIGGTNLEYVDKDHEIFLTQEPRLTSLEFFKYFYGMLNTKVALIDREETINHPELQEKDCRKAYFYDYKNLEDFEFALLLVKNIEFQLIIDLTELYDYEIKENQVFSKKYDFNLKDQFPNSQIVKVSLSSSMKEGEMQNMSIDYLKEYCYFDGEKMINQDLEETCHYMKTLLKNRK